MLNYKNSDGGEKSRTTALAKEGEEGNGFIGLTTHQRPLGPM